VILQFALIIGSECVYIHHPIKYSLAIGPLVFVSAPCDCTETAGFITHPSVCVSAQDGVRER
jgi:hypothetical protein